MPNERPPIRFDHREIAVIFSLFVFVSLLMFTVGILVGKGLAQARYASHSAVQPAPQTIETHEPLPPPVSSSVTTPEPATATESAPPPVSNPTAKPQVDNSAPPAKPEEEPIKLIPAPAQVNQRFSEPEPSPASDSILKNPQIQALMEPDPDQKKRKPASIPSPKLPPPSASQGSFMVQVNSYPTQKDAAERVETLKRIGYPYAYFTAKEIGNNHETWYRVWLGFYPDFESAQKGGNFLKEAGEVKNFLVRRTDTSG